MGGAWGRAGGLAVVVNHREYNRGFMWNFRHSEREEWDRGGGMLADQGLFWGKGDKTVFTSSTVSPALVSDIEDALGCGSIRVVASNRKTPFVSRWLASDREALKTLETLLGKAGEGEFLAWGVSKGVYRLLEVLRKRGCVFETPGLPEGDFLDEARNLDSKTGARCFLKNIGVPVPEGFVVCGHREAAEAAYHLGKKGFDAVIKANHGAGGFCSRVFRAEELLKRRDSIAKRLELFARFDGFWRQPLLVVEKFIGGGGVVPTGDWIIAKDGTVTCLGLGAMTIDRGTLYRGVTLGKNALDKCVGKRCRAIGEKVAAGLFALGYRGLFDADFVVDGEGEVFVNELNLRCSSPAHAMEFARTRWGENWEEERAIVSVDALDLRAKGQPVNYESVRGVFKKFNLEMGGEGYLAVPTAVTNCLDLPVPHIGYLVSGPDAQSARERAGILGESLRRGVAVQ